MSHSHGATQPTLSTTPPTPPADWTERLVLESFETQPAPLASAMGADVRQGLSQTPKTLPPQYFYDARGSELFEQICQLPEYYLTRTEASILRDYAAAIAQYTAPCELIELGSGSSTKTRLLLDAYQQQNAPLCYRPIDVSATILKSSTQQLLSDYPTLKVHGLVGTYEMGLQHLTTTYLPCRLIAFLGSTLGNLNPTDCAAFFDLISSALRAGDFFLLGVDLHKETAQLEAAYNDRQGVTAAFNLNILQHLNQRFNGNFDLSQFEHVAFYNQAQHQIEMHLRSLQAQTVHLAKLDYTVEFQPGETIRSEISRKFELADLQQQLRAKQLDHVQTWTDSNQWFGLMLFQRL